MSTTEPRRSESPQPPRDMGGGFFGLGRRVLLEHPLLTDALLAVALLLLSTAWLVWSPFVGLHAALLQAALVVPLAWRRVRPTGILLLVSAVALVQVLLGYQLIGDVALLVALYTVAVHESRLRTLLATVLLGIGAVLAAVEWRPAGTIPRSLLFLSATVVAALFAGLTVRSGSRYLLWLAERAERLELERDQQATIAATAERTRIAGDMHDIVSHSLSVVITLADAASVVSRTDPERAAQTITQVSQVGRQALGDMRAMIGVLRTDEAAAALAPQPDVTQLGVLIDRIRATGLDVALRVEGHAFPLGSSAGLTVYRIVQEALTNVLKHATAAHAWVTIRYDSPEVDVEVLDDGAAISPSTGTGHGIEGIRERAALFGGFLRAGPAPEGGWAVSTTLRVNRSPVHA